MDISVLFAKIQAIIQAVKAGDFLIAVSLISQVIVAIAEVVAKNPDHKPPLMTAQSLGNLNSTEELCDLLAEKCKSHATAAAVDGVFIQSFLPLLLALLQKLLTK